MLKLSSAPSLHKAERGRRDVSGQVLSPTLLCPCTWGQDREQGLVSKLPLTRRQWRHLLRSSKFLSGMVHASATREKVVDRGAGKKMDRKQTVSTKKKKPGKQNESTMLGHQGAKLDKHAAMRQFAADEILLSKPFCASEGGITCVYAYPNTYSVGICSLGYQLVWSFLAARPDVSVARLFTDAGEPLPRHVELVGFSFSWELDYVNVIALLQELGVPTRSENRGAEHPIVFGGGPVLTANPEPFANLFDVVLLGDGEETLENFLQAVSATRGGGSGGTRSERLRALAQVAGVYVPSLYEVEYESPEGAIASILPKYPDVPPHVKKQTYRGNTLASSTLVSKHMAWENIFMVEVVRSCPEMCRFCLASYVTLPFRAAPLESSLIPAIEKGLQVTDRLGLLGASVTQHPEFDALLTHLLRPEFNHVRLSIASVRAGTVTPKLASALSSRGTRSLTIAVESGSERMRNIVNKKLSMDEIVGAARSAREGGLEALKLYAMVGLPGETDEDVQKTLDMMTMLRKEVPGLRLTLGCSTFVPKAHTPFQWFGVRKEAEERLRFLDKGLRRIGVDFRPESYKWSEVQALLSRGDRRLSRVLERVQDFSGESRGAFRRAFKEMEGSVPPMSHYVHEQTSPGGAMLPWSHLHGPLPESTLVKHHEEALSYF